MRKNSVRFSDLTWESSGAISSHPQTSNVGIRPEAYGTFGTQRNDDVTESEQAVVSEPVALTQLIQSKKGLLSRLFGSFFKPKSH